MERLPRERLQDDLARLAGGDRSAFTPVFETLWPLFRSFASRLVRDPSRGEEIAQEALVRLFRSASRFDPRRDALAWALACVANEARASRRARRLEPIENAAHLPSTDGDPALLAERRETMDALAETLRGLPAGDLETLAASLERDAGPRPAAFRKRLERATRRLRDAWRKRDELA